MHLFLQIAYGLLIFLVILRILYDTRDATKALAYILLVIFLPLLGIFFYFSFGVNYRKRKIYSKKIIKDVKLRDKIVSNLKKYHQDVIDEKLVANQHTNLVNFVAQAGRNPLAANNQIDLLENGEEKFPVLLEALEKAQKHIHLQYYIFADDITGNQIADVLVRKAQEGVEIRFMYDDFGSYALGRKFIRKLEAGGVETAPFYKIIWYAFANRLNYRNHRKIVIIDGVTSFVGGINVSDRYRNDLSLNQIFWRDTHLKIHGSASFFLQYIFISDWNFCSKTPITEHQNYLLRPEAVPQLKGDVVQVVASGPDSDLPVIYYTLIEAINSAKKSIYITSPYFIPGNSLMDALIIAANKNIDIKILVPGKSDSVMVNLAAQSYYTELSHYGVEIYRYERGFVHAKTLCIDDDLSMVGSANMDYRSFDLNFEANAIVYSKKLNSELSALFFKDIKSAEMIDPELYLKRSKAQQLLEKIFRLLSPFL